MSKALEQIIHRFGTHVRVGGVLCLCSNGDPALVSAFAELGWSDPYPIEPVAVAAPVEAVREGPLEAATITAPETAAMPSAKGRIG